MAIEYDEFGPEKVLEFYDPKTKMHGFTVIHNAALGPAKGGIRFTPTVSAEEVFRLARAMSWKTALAELPFGGGKSGIIAPAGKISQQQKDEIIRAFARATKPFVPSIYVAGPDISTTEHEMEVYAKENGNMQACTGKPKALGGLPHELGSTGFGVYHSLRVAAEHKGMDLDKATIAIEGFGNVGWFLAKFLSENFKTKIVAVSDSKGTAYLESGMKFEELAKVKKEKGTVTAYPKAKILGHRELFELGVDILVPGALPDVITMENAQKVKAKMIVEAGNIPMQEILESYFYKKGATIIPDFVANAGGVISSWVEYVHGNEKQMFKTVEERVSRNTKKVLERSESEGIKPRDAALGLARERIRKATKK
ncbi:MAG: Glu/Leu/Phe/Val dehydrogenase [archaeon]